MKLPHLTARFSLALLVTFAVASPSLCSQDNLPGEQLDFFENKVRPLLAGKCYKCHSSERKKPKGELAVDSRQGLLAGGESGPALVPGDAERSRLIEAVRYENPDLQMPPKKKLSEGEIATLVKWVEMGAPDPRTGKKAAAKGGKLDIAGRRKEHWAWKPVARVKVPGVAGAGWPRGDIDRYILSGVQKAGLEPNPSASKRVLGRRAFYSLTGLPPRPEELQEFLEDDSPGAFSDLVDRLLASPHYGEHWGQHWLDLVRFAETKGHEADYPIPEAWRYRDYVIRGFNSDVPYDRWIVEHIAGDLLENPRVDPGQKTNESIQGTGFWHFGEATHSPVDIRGEEADRIHNQIDVFSKTFLGLSLGCARCHDHKFDAISQRDYYAMFGFIQSSGFQLADVLEPGKKKGLAASLETDREKVRAELLGEFSRVKRPQIDRFPTYLAAAAEAIRLGPLTGKPAPKQGKSDEIVFEDFETPGYIGWTVKGAAFGAGPRSQGNLPEHQGDVGGRGKGFVNSHSFITRGKVKTGDQFTGTMLSSAFKIERRFINLLVGGGSHKGGTCVELLVGGKAVASVTGLNSNRMGQQSIDATAWAGGMGRIRIVDSVKNGWGNIGVDHIVFSNQRAAGQPVAGEDAGLLARINDLAARQKLQGGVLQKVVEHVKAALKDTGDPLHAFAKIISAGEGSAAARDQLVARWKQDSAKHQEVCSARKVVKHVKNGERNYKKVERSWATEKDLVVDYGNPGPEDWIVSGYRFGRRPLAAGDLLVGDGNHPVREFVETGRADGEFASRKFYGLLRTPTFEVVGDTLWYRIRGSCEAFLAVDSHRTVHGPLHGVVRKRVKGDPNTWKWHGHNVKDYLDHRVHLEFSNFSENFAVSRVEFSAGSPPGAAPVNPVILGYVSGLQDLSPAGIGKSFAGQLRQSLDTLVNPGAKKDLPGHAKLLNWVLANEGLFEQADTAGLRKLAAAYSARKAEIEKSIPGTVRALALLDGNGENEPLHIRGNHNNRSEEVVPRAILTALKNPQGGGGRQVMGSGRLALARRLASPDNPLVARVMANRVWHHLFGRGIISSCDDFGVMGSPPTHPELLDHLALSFMENGWSLKKLIRSILLSRTYAMSSAPQARGNEVDPENKLLHRMPILRLDAESIRDKVLAVSGRLDRRLYGKGVMVHITEFMRGNRSPGGSGPLDGNGRRSIYTEVRRNHLSSMLLAFDRPIPFMTMGRRVQSNSPAQALILLNDPFVHQQVDIWGKRLLAQKGKSDEVLLSQAYLEAFGRPARKEEAAVAMEFLASQQKLYGEGDRVKAWYDLLHTLMNVKEFIFIK